MQPAHHLPAQRSAKAVALADCSAEPIFRVLSGALLENARPAGLGGAVAVPGRSARLTNPYRPLSLAGIC